MSTGWVAFCTTLACQWTARAAHLWLDEASLLQTSSSAAGEFQQDFRLEDAAPLFKMAYEVAHNDSSRTLEDKAISLLQNLAQHRRVAGTAAQEALLRTASSARQMFDSERLEADDQLETESNSSGQFGGTWNPFKDRYVADYKTYDWVPITSGGDDTGICWHATGGKPLACEVNSWARRAIGVHFATSWQEKGYANPCEQMCGRRYWCSGYEWSPKQPSKKAECILFNDGSGSCEKAGRYAMFGVEPVHSAQDLELLTQVSGTAETPFRKPRKKKAQVMYSRSDTHEYKCVAKYAEPQASGSDVAFTKIDGNAKCQHAMSTPQTPVYLTECAVVPAQLAFVTPKDGSNVCEKLCSDLRWCSGYAYKEPALETADGDTWSMEECSFYTKSASGCPQNGEGWGPATKANPISAGSVAYGTRSPSAYGKLSTHFIPDEDTRDQGWVCMAKEYSGTLLKTKAGAGPMCTVSKTGSLISIAMAIASAVGTIDCPDLTSPSKRKREGASSNGTESAAAPREDAAADIPTLVSPPNVTELLAFAGGLVENFTEGQARSAVKKYSEDTEEDAEAISALRSGKFSDLGKCYLQQSGQALRFLMYGIGSYFGGVQYQCGLLNKAKHFCTSNALKAVGAGIFGAGMYGAPRILQECSSNPLPVTRATCSMDFAKASVFLGKAIWKVIQMVWLSDQDSLLETGLGITDILASLTFVTEGILRSQGPCLGELSGNPDKTKLENGGCTATYVEVAALGLQSLAYGGTAVRYCSAKSATP